MSEQYNINFTKQKEISPFLNNTVKNFVIEIISSLILFQLKQKQVNTTVVLKSHTFFDY
jgi:hypothetical protein